MPWWPFFIGLMLGIFLVVVVANVLPLRNRLTPLAQSGAGLDRPEFVRTTLALLAPAPVAGNRVTPLLNGGEAFPRMLAAIRAARQTITFENFIYWRGGIPRQFAEAFAERARAGVEVRIVLDYVGASEMADGLCAMMREAGCRVVKFRPPTWWRLGRLNNRMHRRVLVVDGVRGFTGGIGIGDEWDGHAQDQAHWRDTHFEVEGPVVTQLQAVFMSSWLRATGDLDHNDAFFPAIPEAGDQRVQVLASSPFDGPDRIRLLYALAFAAARDRILLEQAYFLPDRFMRRVLVDAARRGVRVEIVVPGPATDVPHVRWASRARWRPLLEAGVRIFEYQPTNLHSKLVTIDGGWSSVGSSNFDPRSFGCNEEANLNVFDGRFAAAIERIIAADRGQSQEITLASWRRRRPWQRLNDRFWSALGWQL